MKNISTKKRTYFNIATNINNSIHYVIATRKIITDAK